MSFVTELKRRNVIRIGIAYLTVAWLLIEVSNTVLPLFGFGPDAPRLVVILLAVGFVPVLIVTWAFEFTPDGLKLDRDVDPNSPFSIAKSRRLDRIVIALLGLALSYFVFDKLVVAPTRESTIIEKERQLAATEARESARAIEFDGSIAVLSFINVSGDPSNNYISEGISDELRDRLAQVSGLRVVARSSSVFHQDQPLDAKTIASQLGVSRIIEGRFNRQDNRFVLSVQLIDAQSGFQLWSRSFERASRDLLLLQQDLARAIVNQIMPELDLTDSISAPSAARVSAHDLLLLGRQYEQQVTDEQVVDEAKLQQAIDYYGQAIAQDPELAKAHAGLGKMLLYLGDVDAAEKEIFESLRLDPRLSEAYATLGAYYWITRQPGIGASYQRAIELNPNNADALSYYASWLWLQGDTGQSANFYRLARDVDPLSLRRYAELGYMLAFEGARKEAELVVAKILQLFPNAPGYLAAARIAEAHGAADHAIAFALRARQLRPDDPEIAGQLAEFYWRIGDFETAALFEPVPGMGQLFWQRRYAELVDLGEELVLEQTSDIDVLFLLAFGLNVEGHFDESLRILGMAGMPETAQSESRRAMELHYLPTMASALQGSGNDNRARELAEWNIEISRKMASGLNASNWGAHLAIACSLSILGQDDDALLEIESLPRFDATAWLPWLQDHTCFQKFQSEPRYVKVVALLKARLAAIRDRLPLTLNEYGLESPITSQK